MLELNVLHPRASLPALSYEILINQHARGYNRHGNCLDNGSCHGPPQSTAAASSAARPENKSIR